MCVNSLNVIAINIVARWELSLTEYVLNSLTFKSIYIGEIMRRVEE